MPNCPHLTDALAAAMAGLAPARPPGADRGVSTPDGSRPLGPRRVIPGLRWRAPSAWPVATWEAADAQETWIPAARRRAGGR